MQTKTLNIKSIIAAAITEVEKQMQTVAVTEDNAQDICNELNSLAESIANEVDSIMIPIAIKHECYVSRGDYGSGVSLITEKDHWSGREVGDWLSSSETC